MRALSGGSRWQHNLPSGSGTSATTIHLAQRPLFSFIQAACLDGGDRRANSPISSFLPSLTGPCARKSGKSWPHCKGSLGCGEHISAPIPSVSLCQRSTEGVSWTDAVNRPFFYLRVGRSIVQHSSIITIAIAEHDNRLLPSPRTLSGTVDPASSLIPHSSRFENRGVSHFYSYRFGLRALSSCPKPYTD